QLAASQHLADKVEFLCGLGYTIHPSEYYCQLYISICKSLTTGLILFAISLDGLLFAFSSFGPVVRKPEIHL
ncbi:hypothetical protein, partial [Escherichia coli]|uniref:hypothetical protein n=3 Tax=Escherichia coli TaxID=562 RepID=UPI003004BAF6